MFFSSLTLSLLSLCFVGANNQIIDSSSNVGDKSYSFPYDSYDITFYINDYKPYLLRYDDSTLLTFQASNLGNLGVKLDVICPISYNLSTYLIIDTINDEYTTSFDLLVNDIDTVVYTQSFALDTSNFQFDFSLHFRLLSQTTYDTFVNGGEYQTGYNNGYQEGYLNGQDNGQEIGYNNGYQDGYQEGNQDGYNGGYTTGYNTAMSTHSFTFTNLFASISDTPILMIRRLFGFEIFGVSLIAVFMSLFTALVIIHLIKKVF